MRYLIQSTVATGKVLALNLLLFAVSPRLSVAEEGEPLLRLEAGGPTSYVTALAFSPDEKTLYSGGWDKTVRVWRRDLLTGTYQLDPAAWRVPIGPGIDGAINAVAVSSDGNWLAVGGKAVIRDAADFRKPGRIVPTLGGMGEEMWLDEGTIYVFDTRTRETYNLRGHRGEIRALEFVPNSGATPLLVSAAREWSEESAQFVGAIRLWNAAAAEPYLAGKYLPEPRRDAWPKIAPRRTGRGPTDLEVGIAWGDGAFRVWNAATNRLAESAQQGQFNDTVIRDSAADQFLAGSLGGNGATRFRIWKTDAQGTPSLDAAQGLELGAQPDVVSVPRALTSASSKGDGKVDLFAAVMHRHFVREPAKDQYELWLIGTPLRSARIQPLRLWDTGPPPRRTPAIAAVPGGRRIAVTRGAEIHVFAIDDLLAGKTAAQVLHSAGRSATAIDFVRKADGAMGLMLGKTNGQAGADLLFDLTNGDFAADAAAWQPAAASDVGWKLAPEGAVDPKTGGRIAVTRDGRRLSAIPLEAGREITAYAIGAHGATPILALASHQDGLPSLGLYDATSGRQVRQLTGHAGIIRSLSFSADGALLASSAEDQTVCLWRPIDLDRVLGKRGMAPGVAVREDAAGLIAKVNPTDVGSRTINDGDVLLGRVVDGKLMPWRSAREFYDAFWNAAPGTTMRVRRLRGADAADVDLPAVQGIDERKPLASLFITGARDGEKRGWIAWSPLGPYQSSDEEVEKYLGWHFNTGRPESPVGFADAGKYRKKYYRLGLLDSLIKTGEAPVGEETAGVVTPPTLDLVISAGDEEPTDVGGELLFRRAPTRAGVLVTGFDPAQIEKVDLELDGKPLTNLSQQPDRQTWGNNLAPAAWTRGSHRLRAIVQAKGGSQYTVDRRVRWQPPPPTVIVKSPDTNTTADPTFRFTAAVTPGVEGETVDVILKRRSGKEEVTVKKWETDKPLEIEETINLAEAGNVLELSARNRNASADHLSLETAQQRLAVNYSKAVLPEILRLNVRTAADELPVAVDAKTSPAVLQVNKASVSGQVKGMEGAIEMELSGGVVVPVTVTKSKDGASFNFEAELPLEPGVQSVLLRSKGNKSIETPFRLEFRPPVPQLVVEQPTSDADLIEGVDQPMVAVSAKLEGPKQLKPFEAVVLVNGERVGVVPTIDMEARTFKAEVPVKRGANHIEVQLSNAWNEPRMQSISRVRYLSLPQVTGFGELPAKVGPMVGIEVNGSSASPLTRLEVAGIVLSADAIAYDAASGAWKATLANVPLKIAPSEISAWAWNGDGKSLKPGVMKLPAFEPAATLPTVEISAGGNVTSPDYEVRFTIHSSSPIKAVQVVHDKKVVPHQAAPLAELKPDAAGIYTLEGKAKVELVSGANRLEARAINAGGRHDDVTTVNYIDPPARVVMDRLETVDLPKNVSLPVIARSNSPTVEQPSPSAKVLLHGRLIWPRSTSAALLGKPQRLQVWVNGFQQTPVDIAPVAKGIYESRFSAFVVLNKPTENKVQISLPEIAPDVTAMTDVSIDCENPVREQRLHLLVVGVGQQSGSEEKLKAQTLEALQARRVGRDLRTAAFDRVAIYGPLVGSDITPQQVRNQLAVIKLKIDELYEANRSSRRPANDVVMIYLQGGTLEDARGHFYITTRPATDPRTARAMRDHDPRIFADVALKSGTLDDFLTYTTGAHVLLLDVHGNEKVEEIAKWPSQSRAAMMRFTWLKDSLSPPKARLLAALPEALRSAGELRVVDSEIGKFYNRLVAEFPRSVSYRRSVPESLQTLLVGESVMASP